MRTILAAIALSVSTAEALGAEAYSLTGQALGACIGTQMRFKYDPPERITAVIKEKCGRLEDQEAEQFADFIKSHIGETLTAELALTLVVHSIASPQKMREGAVDAYLKTFKPALRPSPPLQLSK
jgi:hypothetical protein